MPNKKLPPYINAPGFSAPKPLPAAEAPRFKGQTAAEWLEYGLKSAKSGNTELAIRAFTNALKLDPNFADAAYFKGVTLLGIPGRESEALKFLHKALSLYRAENWAPQLKGTQELIEKIKHGVRFSAEDLEFIYEIGLLILKKGRLQAPKK